MRRLSLLVMAGLCAGASAHAADAPAVVSAPLPSISTPMNWYVRGDLAYGWYRMDSASAAPGFANPVVNDLGKGVSGGGGIGYKSNWLRTDFTVDYTSIDYRGTIASPGDTTAKVGAITGLFNGYLDLGTWYCLTPYVGAGLGASRIKTSDYVSTQAPPFTPGLTNTQWRFAWALMAGGAINFSPSFAVDVGYRYLNLGDVNTAADAFGQMTLKAIASHEARVGLRWSIQ